MENDYPEDASLPLRARKKLKAMRRIQAVAIELVEGQGYDSTTIEAIAAAADVSPSSVYRYFETKEGIFLWDEYDPPFLARFDEYLATMPPLQASREALHTTVEGRLEQDQARLLRHLGVIFSVPALENAVRNQTDGLRRTLASIMARRLGRTENELEIRVMSAALVAALFAATEVWYETNGSKPIADLYDASVLVLERGLTLPPSTGGSA